MGTVESGRERARVIGTEHATHLLLDLGSAAVDAGYRVRYLSTAELVDTLYRGLADNSAGKVIDTCSATI